MDSATVYPRNTTVDKSMRRVQPLIIRKGTNPLSPTRYRVFDPYHNLHPPRIEYTLLQEIQMNLRIFARVCDEIELDAIVDRKSHEILLLFFQSVECSDLVQSKVLSTATIGSIRNIDCMIRNHLILMRDIHASLKAMDQHVWLHDSVYILIRKLSQFLDILIYKQGYVNYEVSAQLV